MCQHCPTILVPLDDDRWIARWGMDRVDGPQPIDEWCVPDSIRHRPMPKIEAAK